MGIETFIFPRTVGKLLLGYDEEGIDELGIAELGIEVLGQLELGAEELGGDDAIVKFGNLFK